MPEQFCLKWNDFQSHLHSTFTGLLHNDSSAPLFTDVTLACDDGKQLLAHRLVLAGCSSVFKSILSISANINHHQVPNLYLRGVCKDDLSALLTFMYKGEVSIPQDQLNSFLAVAEDLQVKGLVETNVKQDQEISVPTTLPCKLEPEISPSVKKSRSIPVRKPPGKMEEISIKYDRPAAGNTSAAQKPEHDPYSKYVVSTVNDEVYDNLDNYGDGDMIQDQLSASTPSFSEQTWGDGRTEWTCSLCGKVFHHPGSTSQHIAVHQGRTTCDQCGKIFNRVSDMRTHCRNVHQMVDLQ